MTILTHLSIIRENLLDQLKKHTSVPHTKPGNPIMPSSFNLASNLLKFFHYEIFYYFSSLSTFMLFQHCTAPDSSCPFIQEWSMHTSFTGMCRDDLTKHFGMNTDAVCIALFFTVELIVIYLDLLYASHSLMRLNAHHRCSKAGSFSYDRTSTLIARKVCACISQSFSPSRMFLLKHSSFPPAFPLRS